MLMYMLMYMPMYMPLMYVAHFPSPIQNVSQMRSSAYQLRHVSAVLRIINRTALELTRPLPFDIRRGWGNPVVLSWIPYTQDVRERV